MTEERPTARRVISERSRKWGGLVVGVIGVGWLSVLTVDLAGSEPPANGVDPTILAVIGGVGTVVFAWLFLWRCFRMGVVLDQGEAFEVRGLLRTRRVRWDEVDRFDIDRLRVANAVLRDGTRVRLTPITARTEYGHDDPSALRLLSELEDERQRRTGSQR